MGLYPAAFMGKTPQFSTVMWLFFIPDMHKTINASRDTNVHILGRLPRSPGALLHSQACASSGRGCRIRDGWLRAAPEGAMVLLGPGSASSKAGVLQQAPVRPWGLLCPGAGCGACASVCGLAMGAAAEGTDLIAQFYSHLYYIVMRSRLIMNRSINLLEPSLLGTFITFV